MTNIIVHVGLPKSGSTTLQEKVFSNLPNYLGIEKERSYSNDLGKKIRDLVPSKSNSLFKNEDINSWISIAKKYKRSYCPSADCLIVSNEDLSNRSIASFLGHFSKTNWTEGKVKALLILRNQPEWLCSHYSQLSNRISMASQKHFEDQVKKMIDTGHIAQSLERDGYNDHFGAHVLGFDSYHINWLRRVEDLYSNIGIENVCVLLLEEFGTAEFRDELAEFLEINTNEFSSDILPVISSAENVRKISKNVWKIRPWNGESLAMEKISSSWPSNYLPSLRRITFEFTRRTCKVLHRKRETEIYLTEKHRDQIREFCSPFNSRLSELLEKDLEKHGY